MAGRIAQTYEKQSFLSIFSRVGLSFPGFQAGEEVAYIRIAWNDKSGTYSCVLNCFYFFLSTRLVGRSTQTYE